MLSVQSVAAGYGPIAVLKQVSVQVEPGETVALIGANGAGKTTFLNTLSGIIKVSFGNIFFKDNDITKVPGHRRVKMGISQVPEGRRVFGTLSVMQNLKLGWFGNQEQNISGYQERIEYVLGLFPRLKERLEQKAGTMSGGEQQMLAIGRSLMSNPKLLLLDEPSLGLAPKIVENIFETLELLKKQGVSMLLVEQNATMALNLADRGYVLEVGKISLQGPATDLIGNPKVIELYLGKSTTETRKEC